MHFALCFSQCGLLALEVISFLIQYSVEVVDASQCLGDVVFNSSDSGCEFYALLATLIVLGVEPIDLTCVLTVALSHLVEVFFQLLFLRLQRTVQILLGVQVCSKSGYLYGTLVLKVLLTFKLNIEITILLLPISEYALLVIDFIPEISYEKQISINSGLVVVVHPAFLVVEPVEVGLQGEQLVLQGLVVAFTLSELGGFLLKLGNKSVFVVGHLV